MYCVCLCLGCMLNTLSSHEAAKHIRNQMQNSKIRFRQALASADKECCQARRKRQSLLADCITPQPTFHCTGMHRHKKDESTFTSSGGNTSQSDQTGKYFS